MQIREGSDGPSIRSLLALCHGGGFLFRDHTPGKDHPLHVLRWKDRRAPLQVLSERETNETTTGSLDDMMIDDTIKPL